MVSSYFTEESNGKFKCAICGDEKATKNAAYSHYRHKHLTKSKRKAKRKVKGKTRKARKEAVRLEGPKKDPFIPVQFRFCPHCGGPLPKAVQF